MNKVYISQIEDETVALLADVARLRAAFLEIVSADKPMYADWLGRIDAAARHYEQALSLLDFTFETGTGRLVGRKDEVPE